MEAIFYRTYAIVLLVFIQDIDCMPLYPSENIPTSLIRHNACKDKFCEALKQFSASQRSEDRMKEENLIIDPSQKVGSLEGPSNVSPIYVMSNLPKQAKVI